MFNTNPAMHEVYKRVECTNSISGHAWAEQGKIIGYEVTGGGWMREYFRTEKAALAELTLRNKICAERVERGLPPNVT